jgi:hypothetical protein
MLIRMPAIRPIAKLEPRVTSFFGRGLHAAAGA